MAQIKGLVINLPEAVDRRNRLQAQLIDLGMAADYQFFKAEQGSREPEPRRGLSRGEDGLWRSVLKAMETDLEGAQYLHILEDDAELSPVFRRWCHELPTDPKQEQIIFTDMYAGPSVYPMLLKCTIKAKQKKQISWISGQHYTGCTSSWLIHSSHLPRVYKILSHEYVTSNSMIPIDNMMRRLLLESRLTARISIPFLTSINLKQQGSSSIQTEEHRAVKATRLLGCQLRRRLSVLRADEDIAELGMLMATLLDDDAINDWLATSVVATLQEQKALRYKYDKRLLSEPDNPQSRRNTQGK